MPSISLTLGRKTVPAIPITDKTVVSCNSGWLRLNSGLNQLLGPGHNIGVDGFPGSSVRNRFDNTYRTRSDIAPGKVGNEDALNAPQSIQHLFLISNSGAFSVQTGLNERALDGEIDAFRSAAQHMWEFGNNGAGCETIIMPFTVRHIVDQVVDKGATTYKDFRNRAANFEYTQDLVNSICPPNKPPMRLNPTIYCYEQVFWDYKNGHPIASTLYPEMFSLEDGDIQRHHQTGKGEFLNGCVWRSFFFDPYTMPAAFNMPPSFNEGRPKDMPTPQEQDYLKTVVRTKLREPAIAARHMIDMSGWQPL